MTELNQYPISALTLEPEPIQNEPDTYSHQMLRSLVSVDDVATLFNVHVRTAQRWTNRKQIPCYRIGSVIRYDLEQILKGAVKNNE